MAGAKRALALLAFGAVAVLLAAGCGGGGSGPTKAEYVGQMKVIGQSLSTSLNTLGSATTPAKAATALQSVQTDLRGAADKLEAIKAPDEIKSQHADLVKAVRDFADELDPVIKDLQAGKMTALQAVPTLKGLTEIQTASTAITNKGYKIGG
jgi:hypothetical protein